MKREKIILGIIVTILILGIVLVLTGMAAEVKAITITGIPFGVLGVLGIIGYLFYNTVKARGSSKSFESFYNSGDYEGGVKYFEEQMKIAPAGLEKAKCAYYLMTFYFLCNNLDGARDLFGEIEFAKYEDYVLYYDILLDLYDGMVGDAREKYARFMETKQPDLLVRRLTIKQIFDFIDDKLEEINIKTDYPIIKDIIDRYADMDGFNEENETLDENTFKKDSD